MFGLRPWPSLGTVDTQHITTIGAIQRVTGIDFLPAMTGAKRAEVENFKAALWPKE